MDDGCARTAHPGLAITDAWTALGFADTCAATIRDELELAGFARRSQADLARLGALPRWLGDASFHRSHQSALVRKDPDF